MNLRKITRIIAIIYIIFITLFALDSKHFLELLIHLLPSLIFICILIFSELNKEYGSLAFILAGMGTIIVFNTYQDIIPFIIISLIPIIIGVLQKFSKK